MTSSSRRRALGVLAVLCAAPFVGTDPAQAQQTIKAGNLVITAPWLREPPQGGRVAGGFMKITNTGSESDRLIGGTAAFSKRLEVHEMAVVDGVMRMRELANGIEIKPGETVELKPGGLHVMFMEINDRPRQGGTAAGTLVFQKAGTVAVNFDVTAPAAAGGHGGAKKH